MRHDRYGPIAAYAALQLRAVLGLWPLRSPPLLDGHARRGVVGAGSVLGGRADVGAHRGGYLCFTTRARRYHRAPGRRRA